jgi:hypothetical protein
MSDAQTPSTQLARAPGSALSKPRETPTGMNVAPAERAGRLYPTHDEWEAIFETAAQFWRSQIATSVGLKSETETAMVIYAGWELRVGAMAALQGIKVIKGNPSPTGAFLARLGAEHGGHVEWVQDGRENTAEVIAYRPGRKPARGVYTIQEAQHAGLASKDTWKAYPADLLRARALKRAAWMQYADFYFGYVPEADESDETIDIDAEVVEDAPAAAAAAAPAVAKAARKPAGSAAKPATSAPAATAASVRAAEAAATAPAATSAPAPAAQPAEPASPPATAAPSTTTPAQAPQPTHTIFPRTEPGPAPLELTPPGATQPQAAPPAATTAEPPPDDTLPYGRGEWVGKKLSEIPTTRFTEMIQGYRTSLTKPKRDDDTDEQHAARIGKNAHWLARIEAWAAYRGVVVP